MQIVEKLLSEIKPYAKNPRKNDKAVDKVAASIREFGFKVPIVIDRDGTIVAGHTRYKAAQQLGMDRVPCIIADDLTPEQIKAFRLADNKVGEIADWDFDLLATELQDLASFDMEQFSFNMDQVANGWFDEHKRNDTSRQEGNDEYNEFLDKFEQPKTTDDCYTPDNIYEVVCNWVSNEYKVDKAAFTRPFYPGSDFEKHVYPGGCVVVDNPPFSILAKIVDFYVEKDVKFFLFAPALTALNYVTRRGVCAICTYIGITYENGAIVPTSFLTNLDDPTSVARATPDLFEMLDKANDENLKAMRKSLPKYEFPKEVLTAAKIGWLSKYGQSITIKRDESCMIRELDAMKESGKTIFGKALLLSERAAAERAAAERAAAERAAAERAAAERAAAERAAAERWELSEREKAIVRSLGDGQEAMDFKN